MPARRCIAIEVARRRRHHPEAARMGCRIAMALALSFSIVPFVQADEHLNSSRLVGRFPPWPGMAGYQRVALATPEAGQEESHLLPSLGGGRFGR